MPKTIFVKPGEIKPTNKDELKDGRITALDLNNKIAFKITSGTKGCVGVNVDSAVVKEFIETNYFSANKHIKIFVTGGDNSNESNTRVEELNKMFNELVTNNPNLIEYSNHSLNDVHENSVELMAKDLTLHTENN